MSRILPPRMWSPVQAISSTTITASSSLSPSSSLQSSSSSSKEYHDRSRSTLGQYSPSISGCPTSRCKHAMCVSDDGFIYLMGGRSGSLPLKDVWKFHPETQVWLELKCTHNNKDNALCSSYSKDNLHKYSKLYNNESNYDTITDNSQSPPPNLQEHSMVCFKNKLVVFGGEVGLSPDEETPLWILDLDSLRWRRISCSSVLSPGTAFVSPSGRRGHTAVVFDYGMHVYGGYQDLKGSSDELWTLDLDTEQWNLFSTSSSSTSGKKRRKDKTCPEGRHWHSAVVHTEYMYIFGGMSGLREKNDLWRWSFRKYIINPMC